MSTPQPSTQLEGHCSTIYEDTLYVLSPTSFQSLPLKAHAQWSKETLGVSVIGAACVQAGSGSDTALYVIGGATNTGSYSGLQRYVFSSKSWETLSTAAPVLQGRTDHSVTYLEDSQQILVYAGSQPNAPSYLSSQTFVISTQFPYTIQAYTSMAPPTNMPILQPFNTSHAVMVGGSQWNTQIYTFGPTDGWQPLSTEITGPLSPSCRGSVIDGSDGSKVLEVYDMSVSPNNVTQIVLLDAYGQTAPTGQTIGSGPGSSRKRKRDLSLNTWPVYNDTNAPTVTRKDCSVAQGFRVAVIAGGSSSAPVAIFNQYENSWIDADKFFDSKQKQQPLKPTKSKGSSASTASPTTSNSAASTTAASITGSKAAHDRTLRTLGITLGVLCGIAAIFILVLLYLRWRKIKKRKAEGYLDEKTNEHRMSFADRGASFMKEAGGSVNGLQPPSKAWNGSQNGSHSSLAIITGKFGNRRSNTNGHEPKASYDSTTRLVKDKNDTAIVTEPVELVDLDEKKMAEQRRPPMRIPSMIARIEPKPPAAHYGPTLSVEDAKDARDRRKRSSGWSKYFATSQPAGDGLSHIPSAYVAKPSTQSDASAYSNDRTLSHIPSSVLVPPLDIDFSRSVDGQRLSTVVRGSPSFNDSREDLASRGSGAAHEGQKGLIVDPNRPRSQSETISSYNRSTMSSTLTGEYYHDSGMTPWTPTSTTFKDHLISRPTSDDRPPSSVYEQRIPSRSKGGGFFPGAGTTYRPQKAKMGHVAAPTSDWASPKTGNLNVPKPAEERDSTVTVFPRGVPSAYYGGREQQQDPAKPVNSDLGWLNLGLNNSQTRL